MKNKLVHLLIFVACGFSAIGQQLPVNTCGIVHVYDASGNRLKRIYFCNNGSDPYPSRQASAASAVSYLTGKPEDKKTGESFAFQQIDALYPNPTTGKFSIIFTKTLQNASIQITDINGKTIRQMKASGYKVDFDVSAQAKGVYFIKINDVGNVIVQKVIKQ